jgi:hypothetical protein
LIPSPEKKKEEEEEERKKETKSLHNNTECRIYLPVSSHPLE